MFTSEEMRARMAERSVGCLAVKSATAEKEERQIRRASVMACELWPARTRKAGGVVAKVSGVGSLLEGGEERGELSALRYCLEES